MLMEVKKQLRVTILTIKYAVMREMLNKTTFFTNIIFMILNNASFIIQWLVIYSLKDNIGGYQLKDIILLWGIASSTYGIARFFFKKAFNLSETIINGKLDSFLVQPKNVLISCITTDVEVSAIGDMIYGLIMLIIYGINIKNFILFTIFSISGGFMLVSISVILSSLSFWFTKTDLIADTINSQMVNFATYPDSIFKGIAKIILYTIVPVGFVNYLPIHIINEFNLKLFLILICVSMLFILIAFKVFYKGLKRYSSSNLMISKI